MNEMQSVTLRVPKEIYSAAAGVAKKRGISVNRLVRESLESTLKEEAKQKLYEEFGIVGSDSVESDVSFAFAAQREVVMADDDY